jgi:hypothetical protein
MNNKQSSQILLSPISSQYRSLKNYDEPLILEKDIEDDEYDDD